MHADFLLSIDLANQASGCLLSTASIAQAHTYFKHTYFKLTMELSHAGPMTKDKP
jgi:hypothetical protein